ncbi:hydroxyethylthiazole kinase-like [Pyrus ussuriensis x Pyrus communis]|uniref:hydroxyethylthiazole kinase n=1 Tax=Pyrus ussuriensis x Pyrus communis TaxID=2448454 RepID=A0A5N5HDR6_9ROSA|nr:hydroxyethylthiazole kinase-like [Pyrus ussuriensis x Pyrus communis]
MCRKGDVSCKFNTKVEEETEVITWAQKAWALLSLCITHHACIEELPYFTQLVHVLCVNLGTLSADWLPATKVVAQQGPNGISKVISQSSDAIIAVSGAIDIVTNGKRVVGPHNGVAMLTKITTTGCSVTTLIVAFVACMIVGKVGMKLANGAASLRMHLIDSLYGLDEVRVLSHVKIANLS